jgi:two-component system NarL family sensor kinase
MLSSWNHIQFLIFTVLIPFQCHALEVPNTNEIDLLEAVSSDDMSTASKANLHQQLCWDYPVLRRELGQVLGLIKEQKMALFDLYEIEQETGNIDVALNWFERYMQANDSLFKIVYRQKLLALEERYEAKQNAQEVHDPSAENLVQNDEPSISFSSIGIAFLMTLLVTTYFLFRNRRQKQHLEHTTAMNSERINQLISDQENVTLEAVAHTRETERTKLAKDIHDNLGSYLATIKYQHESSMPTTTEKRLNDSYNATAALISQACAEVRAISHQMATGHNFDFSLSGALEQLVERVRGTKQFVLLFNCFGEDQHCSRATELELYKIAQELLSNVMKHAHATEVTLQINQSEEEITLMLEDNGIGFAPSKRKMLGMGLSNLEERTAALNGKLDINSELNRGTTILVAVPLHQNEMQYD